MPVPVPSPLALPTVIPGIHPLAGLAPYPGSGGFPTAASTRPVPASIAPPPTYGMLSLPSPTFTRVPLLPLDTFGWPSGPLGSTDPLAAGAGFGWPEASWGAGFDDWSAQSAMGDVFKNGIEAQLEIVSGLYSSELPGVAFSAAEAFGTGLDLFRIHEVGRGAMSPDALAEITPHSVMAWHILRGRPNAGDFVNRRIDSYYDDGALRVTTRGNQFMSRWSPAGFRSAMDLYGFDPRSSSFTRFTQLHVTQHVSFSGARFQPVLLPAPTPRW
jgi:hypothetical protein